MTQRRCPCNTRADGKKDIQFFLNAGPMENNTIGGTQLAIKLATAQGLKATFVDMQTACVDANLHQADNGDHCDGCAGHPGIQGHRGMCKIDHRPCD
jgi:hypothetical protein